ncbi:50S ribosomal protein L4 [Candidatus Babeliales bacterium]|nr:50S ribosomal protein L4 [Candidatus Babeliales bacterium]
MQVYGIDGKVQEKLDLAELDLNRRELSPRAYSCAVKVLRQNWRQGTVSCKGRGEISFSGKKPWKQKGTGRARVGTKSSPLWRKGGVTFGPQPRVRLLKLPKNQRALVFNNIFHLTKDSQNISCLDFVLENKKPNVKSAFGVLKALGLEKKRVVLFLNPFDLTTMLSFRNLPNVKLLSFDEPNAYDLTFGEHWVFLKQDLDLFKKMVSRWN